MYETLLSDSSYAHIYRRRLRRDLSNFEEEKNVDTGLRVKRNLTVYIYILTIFVEEKQSN